MRKCLMVIFLAVISFQSTASFVEMNSGMGSFTGIGTGEGRGIGIRADADFSIDSIGIFGDLLSQSYDVQIYSSSDGNQANAVLASASFVVGGTGNDWYDIDLDYSFDMGSHYVLHWRSSDGSTDWTGAGPAGDGIVFFPDFFLPVGIAGLATLINGTEGFDAENFDNGLHPQIRVNTVNPVPLPAAVWLFGTALIGLVGFNRRRKAV